MAHYHVIARRYRPQCFADVLGQDHVVTALCNSLKSAHIAHAYLFSGGKGTGKTTLARLFAKALNCSARKENGEPCNQCTSCVEMQQGTSLDLLEMDGASNRGIDDIRKIHESVGYRPFHGRYTLYLIDEVHMLTKEAFNALLKTLEEPPAHVVFLFATTELHKIPPTILSRCQRFSLRRISEPLLAQKLRAIVTDLGREAEDRALSRIASLADGAFRDAECLLDQLLAFHEGRLTESAVETLLGLSPHALYLQLDEAGAKGDLKTAFTVVEQLFTDGMDFMHFFEGLLSHIRTLLTIRLVPPTAPKPEHAVEHSSEHALEYSKEDLHAASLYEVGQLLHLFDYLTTSHERLRRSLSPRITLESILLYVLRSHRTVSFPQLMDRLTELEKAVSAQDISPQIQTAHASPQKVITTTQAPFASIPPSTPSMPPSATTLSHTAASLQTIPPMIPQTPSQPSHPVSHPTPTLILPSPTPTPSSPLSHELLTKRQSHYETILQFASIELPGRIEKTTHFSQ